jgi:hypothetical protein
MMTGHEIGAALGVAVLSVVAGSASGAAGGVDALASGYGDGFLAAAAIAGVLVVVTLAALPAGRIVGAARAAMH